jgi:hypothetical protein
MGATMPCTWFEEWLPCDTCGGRSDGYDEWDAVRLSVNGRCYIAFSTVNSNTQNPAKYLGNTDSAKPWIVEPYAMFIAKLARNMYTS